MSDISKQLSDTLQQYAGTVGEDIASALSGVGKEAAAMLRRTSPKRTGKYRRGWTATVERSADNITVTVHNKQYRLTHLLEFGHKVKGGGRTKAQPHIADVEAWAVSEVQRAIEKAVKG